LTFLDSGFALPFIERSIARAQFSLQRDVGLQLSGDLLGTKLVYAADEAKGFCRDSSGDCQRI
jgi:hypothetical protein